MVPYGLTSHSGFIDGGGMYIAYGYCIASLLTPKKGTAPSFQHPIGLPLLIPSVEKFPQEERLKDAVYTINQWAELDSELTTLRPFPYV